MTPAAERPGRDRDFGAIKADWVGKVVKEPAKSADALALNGYLGDSAKDEHVRLYFDIDLSNWVDIPLGDVLHAQRLPEDHSPLGEVVVWIRRSAQVTHGAGAQQRSGTFFEGPIFQEQYAAAAAFAGEGFGFGGVPGAPGITLPPCGGITLPPACIPPTLPPACPIQTLPPRCIATIPPRCPPRTPAFGCPQSIPVFACPVRTPIVPCVTLNHPFCPPLTSRCPVTQYCPQTNFCPRTTACPETQLCPRTQICPQSAAVVCSGICPSVVDGCPSAPGGCDTPWNPGGVINPGGYFGGGYGG